MAFRSSLLAGIPATTVPSFLAAAKTFSHSLAESAACDDQAVKAKSSPQTKPLHPVRFIAVSFC
jgi:hypothetical protein